ncbi:MAG: FAD-dependent oxidoreductase, partial [Cocleimonas sp.]|nr:FAD-dependent oxidoreductase [Cocleimonas sp.]
EMKKRDIDLHIGHKMKGFEANKVMTEGGDIESDLIIFMPGMTGPSFAPKSELPLSAGGLIEVNKYCQVETLQHVYVAGDSGSFPGPAWQPKQAHMADLQAVAAANNLLDEFDGKPATHTFKYELMCIIDSLTKGSIVFRNEKRTVMLPALRIFHLAKRFFEWWYLRAYR